MPIYEYQSIDQTTACQLCYDKFERFHPYGQWLDACPECGNKIERLVSLCNGFAKKQPNQYPEVKHAKYWRDQNGVRHKVTDADGHAKSATVSRKQTVPQEKVEAKKKADYHKTRMKIRHGGWGKT